MSKMVLTVQGAGLELFGSDKQKRGGGTNFRIRLLDGVVFIKASSRTTLVEGEAFGALDLSTNSGVFEALPGMQAGEHGFAKAQRGWQALNTPAADGTGPSFILSDAAADAVATTIAKPTKPEATPAPAAVLPTDATTADRIAYIAHLDITPALEQDAEFQEFAGEFVLELANKVLAGTEVSGEDACAVLNLTPTQLREKILSGELETRPGNLVVLPAAFEGFTAA